MCILAAVGPGATNSRSDVIAIQALLNLNAIGGGPARLSISGTFDAATSDAIRKFQAEVMGTAAPDGRVDPGGATLESLRGGIATEPSADLLRGIMPTATPANIDRYLPHLAPTFTRYDISTALRQAHFLAQVAHECGAFRYKEELASGDAYENRGDLGNTQPGDGRRFKGRGLIQLTGRANYERYGTHIGRDLVTADGWLAVAEDSALAVDVAGWYWSNRKINVRADQDDVERVTRLVNGGFNGLDDRKANLARAKFFLKV